METRADFDANLNRLIGFVVNRVNYFEIDYQDGRPYFRDHPETGHFLDFGVEMVDSSGRCACITWDGTFFQYGLGVFVDCPSGEVMAGLSYDVTNEPEWMPFIGRRISHVDSYWSWVADDMEPNAKRTYYPQDIRLTFDNNRHMYFSAAQFFNDSGKLFGMSDNVLIVFNDDVAERHQLGPWAVA
jgi:hypothetical protein